MTLLFIREDSLKDYKSDLGIILSMYHTFAVLGILLLNELNELFSIMKEERERLAPGRPGVKMFFGHEIRNGMFPCFLL